MNHSYPLAAFAVATLAGACSGQVLLLDFGRTDRQSDPTRFNNFFPGTDLVGNAIDEDGNLTGYEIEITDSFFDTGEPSSLGTESPMGAAAQFGVEATDDYYFGHTTAFAGAEANPLAVIEFRNLDLGKVYDFTIFAARTGVSDTRDAQFDLLGANASSGSLNASNNDSVVLVLAGLVPDGNGDIVLSVTPGPNNDNGNGFFYLGAIRVDGVVPAPSAAACLGLGGLMTLRRRRSRA